MLSSSTYTSPSHILPLHQLIYTNFLYDMQPPQASNQINYTTPTALFNFRKKMDLSYCNRSTLPASNITPCLVHIVSHTDIPLHNAVGTAISQYCRGQWQGKFNSTDIKEGNKRWRKTIWEGKGKKQKLNIFHKQISPVILLNKNNSPPMLQPDQWQCYSRLPPCCSCGPAPHGNSLQLLQPGWGGRTWTEGRKMLHNGTARKINNGSKVSESGYKCWSIVTHVNPHINQVKTEKDVVC